MNFSTNLCWVTGLDEEKDFKDADGCGDLFEEGYQHVIEDLDKK